MVRGMLSQERQWSSGDEIQDVLHPWRSHGAAFMEPQEQVQGTLERLWSSVDMNGVQEDGVLGRLWNTRFGWCARCAGEAVEHHG